MKLYKITVTDPYSWMMSGTSTSDLVLRDVGGRPAPLAPTKWTTIVPATHYLEALRVAAEKFKPPFSINVDVAGDIDDVYMKEPSDV